MGSVVEEQLGRGNDGLRANGRVDLDQTGTLHSECLQVAIRAGRRNRCSSSLEETPQALDNIGASTLGLED